MHCEEPLADKIKVVVHILNPSIESVMAKLLLSVLTVIVGNMARIHFHYC